MTKACNFYITSNFYIGYKLYITEYTAARNHARDNELLTCTLFGIHGDNVRRTMV